MGVYCSFGNAVLQNPSGINVSCLRLGEAGAGTFSREAVYICGTLLNICCGFPTAAVLELWGDGDHEYSGETTRMNSR